MAGISGEVLKLTHDSQVVQVSAVACVVPSLAPG
jgi:hypothetical protein